MSELKNKFYVFFSVFLKQLKLKHQGAIAWSRILENLTFLEWSMKMGWRG